MNLELIYSSFNGGKWAAPKTVPGSSIIVETGPAVAEFSHSLVTAWDPSSPRSPIDYSLGP